MQELIYKIKENPPSKCCLWLVFLLSSFIFIGCSAPADDSSQSIDQSPSIQLSDLDITTGQTIFVPAYSEIPITRDRNLDLAVTLAIHNTDFENPIVITSVRYFDTNGQLIREYLEQPQQLGALASTEYFVDANEQSGGIGTNFIVEWVAEQPVFEPAVEAVMLNTSNNQGISLTSPGRVINQISPQEN